MSHCGALPFNNVLNDAWSFIEEDGRRGVMEYFVVNRRKEFVEDNNTNIATSGRATFIYLATTMHQRAAFHRHKGTIIAS